MATLPRFKKDLISVYNEKEDSEYKKLKFHLIGVIIRTLSVPELMY